MMYQLFDVESELQELTEYLVDIELKGKFFEINIGDIVLVKVKKRTWQQYEDIRDYLINEVKKQHPELVL